MPSTKTTYCAPAGFGRARTIDRLVKKVARKRAVDPRQGWSAKERETIAGLMKEKGLSRQALLRGSLRLYQMAHVKAVAGLSIGWVNSKGALVREKVGGCGC